MRRLVLLLVYVTLLGLGWAMSAQISVAVEDVVHTIGAKQAQMMIWGVAGLYAGLSAIPFVPGAEIGIALLVTFGAQVAGLVYASTVAALVGAFVIGRVLPSEWLCKAFRWLGLRRAAQLVEDVAGTPAPERMAFLAERAPKGVGGYFVRFRYLALALAFNVPGNTLVGGGGGIALVAGMTRMFSVWWFVLTVALAVAPVPLLVFVFAGNP